LSAEGVALTSVDFHVTPPSVLISQKTKIFVLTGLPKPLARKKRSRHAAGNRWQGKNWVGTLPANGKAAATVTGNVFKALN